jgi:hypothetical protein
VHFPLYFMHRLAEELLRNAKSALRGQREEGYVDFLIVKNTGTPRTSAGQMQRALYEPGGEQAEGKERLTERPYQLGEFFRLIHYARILKESGLARTQRYALAGSLRSGRVRSTVDVLLFWARRSERDEKQQRIRQELQGWAEQLMSSGAPGRVLFPWQEHPGERDRWTTQLLDVLELMEWI